MDRPEHQRILEEFEFIADEMQIRENRRDRAYCEALCARYAMLLWEARNDDLLAGAANVIIGAPPDPRFLDLARQIRT